MWKRKIDFLPAKKGSLARSSQDLLGLPKMVDLFLVRLHRDDCRSLHQLARGAARFAVLGTTIIPYLLFWQPEEEVEQMNSESKEKPLVSGK